MAGRSAVMSCTYVVSRFSRFFTHFSDYFSSNSPGFRPCGAPTRVLPDRQRRHRRAVPFTLPTRLCRCRAFRAARSAAAARHLLRRGAPFVVSLHLSARVCDTNACVFRVTRLRAERASSSPHSSATSAAPRRGAACFHHDTPSPSILCRRRLAHAQRSAQR